MIFYIYIYIYICTSYKVVSSSYDLVYPVVYTVISTRKASSWSDTQAEPTANSGSCGANLCCLMVVWILKHGKGSKPMKDHVWWDEYPVMYIYIYTHSHLHVYTFEIFYVYIH